MAITLLIVDDSIEDRELLAKFADASKLGIETKFLYASTLDEAREITLANEPNLTFLDLHLPDASIREVLDSIHHFNPPVIVVTAMASDTILDGHTDNIYVECLGAGAEAMIQKGTPRYFHSQIEWMKVVHKRQVLANAQTG